MRSYRALGSLMFFCALMLPFLAFADSQLASGTHGPLRATAHLRFRIIIPTVLSLTVADSTRIAGAQTVTVTTNSRNVALGATLGNSSEVTRRLVLSAAARRGIAQEASCTAGLPQEAIGNKDAGPVKRFCTVSMP
jgi:hypothetical protein